MLSLLEQWVRDSQLDKVVLLALDGAYDRSGRFCQKKTVLYVDNSFVLSASRLSPCFIFGASIHPYRKDAVSALEEVVRQGACLVKWIPSGQYIEPDDPQCIPFYEALAHYKIPLLTHTGVEHTLGWKRTDYNSPDRLIPALDMGVSVIAAHCGTRLFLHEKSFFDSWCTLARKYENFFGDLGAFTLMTRIPSLKKILAHNDLRQKVLYGSDFPSAPLPIWCWQLGIKKMRVLNRIDNPLERNLQVMQSLEVPTEIFEKAASVLPLQTEQGLNNVI
jgi:predicted TIM-barrel fold metal-dependent hydrolase